MPNPLLIFCQSDYLIWIFAINSLNGKQCRSRSVGFFRSQLIWIYIVCKGRVYLGSAGQGLMIIDQTPYVQRMHMSKFKDRRVHFRNSGMKGSSHKQQCCRDTRQPIHFSETHGRGPTWLVYIYLALPTTTVCAQGCRISLNDPLSKKPLCHSPFVSEEEITISVFSFFFLSFS